MLSMKWTLLFITVFFAGALAFVSCSKSSQAPSTGTTPANGMSGTVSFDWDKGPTNIDAEVAKYPKDLQTTYNTIVKVKCSQCHPVARALWAPYYDQATWTKIINKMAHRAGSPVTDEEAAKVLKFVVYDHQHRQAEIEKMFQDNHWQKQQPYQLQ